MRMGEDPFQNLRRQMVAEIVTEAALTAGHTGRAAFSERVLDAIGTMPRHEFVPVELQPYAYLNRPLPIGYEKTVSQPFIVALMTDLLDPKPGDSVLEVGTGSGYQAAVVAEIVARVYTIEIVEELGRKAEQTLKSLGYANVVCRVGDGYAGWPEHAPFDSIMVTAAAPEVPQPLIDQLKPGGRLVIPVGGQFEIQLLLVVEKKADGTTTTRRTIPVRFVPLVRGGLR